MQLLVQTSIVVWKHLTVLCTSLTLSQWPVSELSFTNNLKKSIYKTHLKNYKVASGILKTENIIINPLSHARISS